MSESDKEFVERMRPPPEGAHIYDSVRLDMDDYGRLRALARRGAEKDAEIAVLRAAMLKVTDALNQGRIVPRASVSGMTIDAQLRNSVYTGVPCGPIEDAIEMLDEAGLRKPLPPPPEGEK